MRRRVDVTWFGFKVDYRVIGIIVVCLTIIIEHNYCENQNRAKNNMIYIEPLHFCRRTMMSHRERVLFANRKPHCP